MMLELICLDHGGGFDAAADAAADDDDDDDDDEDDDDDAYESRVSVPPLQRLQLLRTILIFFCQACRLCCSHVLSCGVFFYYGYLLYCLSNWWW